MDGGPPTNRLAREPQRFQHQPDWAIPSMNDPQSPSPSQPPPPPAGVNPNPPGAISPAAGSGGVPEKTGGRSGGQWLIFGLVLLSPAILTMLFAQSADIWPIFTFGLSALTSLYCGFWLAWTIGRTTAVRILVGLLLSGGFYFISFLLCCAGCALGEAKLDMR
jgi:hypothetical protein